MAGNWLAHMQYNYPDPIGVDQLKRKNALADRGMQLDEERNAQYGRQLDMTAESQRRNFEQQDSESRDVAVQRMSAIAKRALSLDATQRRAFLAQAGQAYGSSFKALGANADPAALQQVPDEQLEGALQRWAMLGQEPQGDVPSNVREWQYYKELAPEDQTAYREMKRQQNPFTPAEFGGARGSFNKNTGDFTPLASLEDQVSAEGQIAGAKAGEAERAKTTVEAQFDLGRVEQNVNDAVSVLDQLSEHKGLPYIVGAYSLAPIVPNTEQAAADALALQVQGQSFLQAFQSLKGGGAITEVEGNKAEAAIARLSRKQKLEDYKAALSEVRGILNRGLERARKKAGGAGAQNAGAGEPVTVRSVQEAQRLPPGTVFRTPDGRLKVR